MEDKHLWDVLAAFGFSKDFLNKIRVLYSDVESILKINGALSAPLNLIEVCPLSGMLYSIAMEPFLYKLKQTLPGRFVSSLLLYSLSFISLCRGHNYFESLE